MGLYLCVFRDDEELEGVEVGSYADFGSLRDLVGNRLERGALGSRFPTLMLHSDCDGVWRPDEVPSLRRELTIVAEAFRGLPPIGLSGWKATAARTFGIRPANLYDCFFDVDGEPLFERLIGLCDVSVRHGLPILFQ